MALPPDDIQRYAISLYQRLEDSGCTVVDAVFISRALGQMVAARADEVTGTEDRGPLASVDLKRTRGEVEAIRPFYLERLRCTVLQLEGAGLLDTLDALRLRRVLAPDQSPPASALVGDLEPLEPEPDQAEEEVPY